MTFSENMLWGAATSAYQIEGAVKEDGRGDSIWDMYARTPGKIYLNHNADVTCDHYHRVPEDIAIMKKIGLQSYRFSIAWPRIIPDGDGEINLKGLQFYSDLVDQLIAAGIKPIITLYHWDLPYALHCKGAWLNPESPQWFLKYTQAVVNKLGDRVTEWITFNEPNIFIPLGYGYGIHAPGVVMDLPEKILMGHHVLLAHGHSMRWIKAQNPKFRVGIAPAAICRTPATPDAKTIEAARMSFFSVDDPHLQDIGWWLEPVFKGHYLKEEFHSYPMRWPEGIKAKDFDIIQTGLDFLGVNIYGGDPVKIGPDGKTVIHSFPMGSPLTAYNWNVLPESLYWGPKFLFDRYQAPIVVTENGMAHQDFRSSDGQVHDPQRIEFLSLYLKELRRAAADGVKIEGYYLWSLLDNYEWAEGFKQRFGIVYVDYQTQERVIKDSALWYKKVIESKGTNLEFSYQI